MSIMNTSVSECWPFELAVDDFAERREPPTQRLQERETNFGVGRSIRRRCNRGWGVQPRRSRSIRFRDRTGTTTDRPSGVLLCRPDPSGTSSLPRRLVRSRRLRQFGQLRRLFSHGAPLQNGQPSVSLNSLSGLTKVNVNNAADISIPSTGPRSSPTCLTATAVAAANLPSTNSLVLHTRPKPRSSPMIIWAARIL